MVSLCVDPEGDNLCEFYEYDANAANPWDPSARRMPGGNTYRFSYDGLGQLGSVQDPDGNVFDYVWRPDGVMLMETGGGNSVSYGYDEFGRTISETITANGDSLTRSWIRNADGDVTVFRDFEWESTGREMTYTYDPATQRLLEKRGTPRALCQNDATSTISTVGVTGDDPSCPPGSSIVGIPAGETVYQYDDGGRLLHATLEIHDACTSDADCPAATGGCASAEGAAVGICRSPRQTTTSYDYTNDANLLRRKRTYSGPPNGSNNGNPLTYEYTFENNQLVGMNTNYWGTGDVEVTFDGLGRTGAVAPWGAQPFEFEYSEHHGGVRRQRGMLNVATLRDQSGRVTRIAARAAGRRQLLLQYSDYDANGNVGRIQERWGQEEALVYQYGYDELNRLWTIDYPELPADAWGVQVPGEGHENTYDARGNPTTLQGETFAYENDRIVNDGYAYDLNGNLTRTPPRGDCRDIEMVAGDRSGQTEEFPSPVSLLVPTEARSVGGSWWGALLVFYVDSGESVTCFFATGGIAPFCAQPSGNGLTRIEPGSSLEGVVGVRFGGLLGDGGEAVVDLECGPQ